MPYDGKEGVDNREKFKQFRPKDDGRTTLLHGHCHSPPDKRLRLRMLDVGVDGNNYEPISYEECLLLAGLNK